MDAGERAARYKYIHRRGFRGGVVHEAYPGHHLQLQMASRVDDDVRKWQQSLLFLEGWALYCEEMMSDFGFYKDERQYLTVLRGIITDEAVQWIAETMDIEPAEWIRTEVRRYAQQPTIPMCYLTGKLEILKLRDDLKAIEGTISH